MKKNKRNLRNPESIVNHIVCQPLAKRWDLLRKLHVDHTKIVISKFAFLNFFIIIITC